MIDENRPIIYTKILPLKELTSIQVVAEPCYQKLQRRECSLIRSVGYEIDVLAIRFHAESLLRVQLPPAIQLTLESRISSILMEVKHWADYHGKRIFAHRGSADHILNFLTDIVWKSDGYIHYLKTALKMLVNSIIDEREKFRIVSLYCLENEIMKISPFHCKDYYGFPSNSQDKLMSYWYSLVHNKPMHPRYRDVEMVESTTYGVNNIHAILYFWKRLTSDQQIRAVINLIQRHGTVYQSDLLSQLNEAQQKQVFAKIGPRIIINFAYDKSSIEFAVLTWTRLKNTITEEEFVTIIVDMIMRNEGSRFLDFFGIILKTVPNHLKPICLDVRGRLFNLLTSFQNIIRDENRILFLLKIVPELSNNDRRYVLDKLIAEATTADRDILNALFYYERPQLLDNLLTLCLLDRQERAAFRQKFITCSNVENCCFAFLERLRWSYLEEFVKLYLPYVTNVAEYKAQLLNSEEGKRFCLHFFESGNHYYLRSIIDHVFPQTETAEKFRRNLMLSHTALEMFHQRLIRGGFFDVGEFIRKILSPESVEIFEKRIICFYRCHHLCEIFHVGEPRCQMFMYWLFHNNDDRLSKFKRSLHLDHIFQTILAYCMRMTRNARRRRKENFSRIDRFLNWYFKSPEEIQNFKFRAIFEFTEIHCINEMFTPDGYPNNLHDTRLLEGVLKWFFSGARDEIRTFKTLYAHHKIINSCPEE